jgi:hypothetical protein
LLIEIKDRDSVLDIVLRNKFSVLENVTGDQSSGRWGWSARAASRGVIAHAGGSFD